MKTKQLLISLILGLGLALVLIWALQGGIPPAVLALSAGIPPSDSQPTAQGAALALGADRVPGAGDPRLELAQATNAPTAELHVCPAGPPACDYATVQAAVDAANADDVIKIATGDYTGVHARAGVTQVVYITKSLTLRGGYDTADWNTSDPGTNPTTLDAEGQGRVLYVTGPGIAVTIEGLRITGGDATAMDSRGGGGYIHAATVTISGNVIYSNTARTAAGEVYGQGGGLFLDSASAIVNDNVISGNIASTYEYATGGGLRLDDCDATLTGNAIRDNVASAYAVSCAKLAQGGGVYLHDGTVAMVSNTIQSNIAAIGPVGSGGGLYYRNGNALTLTNNAFLDNIGGVVRSGYGGGIHIYHSDATLNGNLFQGNESSQNNSGLCGALHLESSSSTLIDNDILYNSAGDHGGGMCTDYGSPTLIGNTIQGNTASMAGGMYLDRSDVTLIGNAILDNTATGASGSGFGGGLHFTIATDSDPVIRGNVIAGNEADDQGGGLYVTGSTYQGLTLDSNVLADNQAGQHGAALYVYRGFLHLSHTTLARNSGPSGVYVTGSNYSSAIFTNTIVYSHTVGVQNAGGPVSMTLTLWENNGSDTAGAVGEVGSFPGSAAFDTDSYHLTVASDAIDAGIDAGVTASDVDGQPRWMGPAPDLGADEYPYYADLSLSKVRQESGTVNAGERVTFTLTITNDLSSEVEADALLVDTLSPASAVAGFSTTSSTCGSCLTNGAVVTCMLDDVPTATACLATVVITTASAYDGILANTATIIPTDAVDPDDSNNDAGPVHVQVKRSVRMNLDKAIVSSRWEMLHNPRTEETQLRFRQEYAIHYLYETLYPNTSPVSHYTILDDWPDELTYESQSSQPRMDFSPYAMRWTSRQPLPANSEGWAYVAGFSDLLSSDRVITNRILITYTVGAQTLTETAVVSNTAPQVAPHITWPSSNGETCSQYVDVEGAGQPDTEVIVYLQQGTTVVSQTALVDAQGTFFVTVGPLSNTISNTIFARARVPGESNPLSDASNSIILVYKPSLFWDPISLRFEATYSRGDVRIYHPRDANGWAVADNWQVPVTAPGLQAVTISLRSCTTETITVTVNSQAGLLEDPNPPDRILKFNVKGNQLNRGNNQITIKAGQQENRGNGKLVDPDGYVFDVTQGWGHTVEGVTVTCMVSMTQWGGWVPWPAHLYEGQVNPQVTDDVYPDGVLEPGYFAFFTPPGHYYIQVEGIKGYQPWRSPVVEVITEIVHVNVPYTPWPEGILYTITLTPEGLSRSIITIPTGSSVEWASSLNSADPLFLNKLTLYSENPILRPLSTLDPISDTLGWDAGMLEPGRVYRRRFGTPGVYHYTDGAGHSGVVVVEGFAIYLPIVLRSYTP